MNDTAGWGTAFPFSPSLRAQMAALDAKEQLEAAAAKRDRQARAEQWQAANMRMFAEQCEQRGTPVSQLDVASGRVTPRPIAEIFAQAIADADADDAKQAARAAREGQPGPVHITFDEPTIHGPAAKTPVARAIAERSRHWRAWQARRADAAAERAALESAGDYGLVGTWHGER